MYLFQRLSHFSGKKKVARIILLLLLITVPFSLFLSKKLSSSKIDISLDLFPPQTGNPTVSWKPAQGQGAVVEQMQPISPEYSLGHIEFQVVTEGVKSPGYPARGSHGPRTYIFGLANYKQGLTLQPESGWEWGLWGKETLISHEGCVRPAKAEWRGFIPFASSFNLTFRKDGWGGLSTLKYGEKEQVINQFSREAKNIVIEIPAEKLRRYHIQVPRSALANLLITFPGDTRPSIHRLYIGTIIPRVLITTEGIRTPPLSCVGTNWLPDIRDNQLVLPSMASVEQGGMLTFLVILLVLLLIGFAAILLVRFLIACFRRVRTPSFVKRELKPFSWRSYLCFTAPFLIVWLFVLACFFPALFVYDSYWHWEESHTKITADFHPPMVAITFKAITSVIDSPAAVVVVQIFGMAGCLAYGFHLLYRAGVPLKFLMLGMLLTLASPSTAIISISLVKETFYAIFIMLLGILLTHYLLDSRVMRRPLFLFMLVVALVMTPLYRHNGVLVFLGMCVLMPILLWRVRWAVLICIAAAVLAYSGIKYVYYPTLGLRHWYVAKIPFCQPYKTSAFLDLDPPLAEEEYAFLGNAAPFYEVETGFGVGRQNNSLYERLNHKFINENLQRYKELHRSLLLRNPMPFLWVYLQTTDWLYWPFSKHYIETTPLGILNHANDIGRKYNIYNRPLLPSLFDPLNKLLAASWEMRTRWLFWIPGTQLWIILISAAGLLWKFRDPRLLLPYMPFLLNTLSLAIIPSTRIVRYQFSLFLIVGFLASLAFLPKIQKEEFSDDS